MTTAYISDPAAPLAHPMKNCPLCHEILSQNDNKALLCRSKLPNFTSDSLNTHFIVNIENNNIIFWEIVVDPYILFVNYQNPHVVIYKMDRPYPDTILNLPQTITIDFNQDPISLKQTILNKINLLLTFS